MPTEQAVALMNAQDAAAVAAVGAERANVARAVELVAAALAAGGRLIYVGAGTSGRLGVLDAAECPPTFRTPPEMVQGDHRRRRGGRVPRRRGGGGPGRRRGGGGGRQGRRPRRRRHGDRGGGDDAFRPRRPAPRRRRGARTIFLSCVQPVPGEPPADVVIRPLTGPEVLTGSTRLKAGTATKLVLNTISTLAMVRLGKVHQNLMVDLRATNAKLPGPGCADRRRDHRPGPGRSDRTAPPGRRPRQARPGDAARGRRGRGGEPAAGRAGREAARRRRRRGRWGGPVTRPAALGLSFVPLQPAAARTECPESGAARRAARRLDHEHGASRAGRSPGVRPPPPKRSYAGVVLRAITTVLVTTVVFGAGGADRAPARPAGAGLLPRRVPRQRAGLRAVGRRVRTGVRRGRRLRCRVRRGPGGNPGMAQNPGASRRRRDGRPPRLAAPLAGR